MIKRIQEIAQEAEQKIAEAKDNEELSKLQILYLAKKSELMSFMAKMKDMNQEERASFGEVMNSVKNKIQTKIDEKRKVLKDLAMEHRLKKEALDITLPGENYERGAKHLFQKVVDEVSDIFIGMGYQIEEGPEVELDHFNFELLNVPKDHPARDMQDSFYIDETHLMRSQTSPVQARVMLSKNGVGPIKIISPGKTFRRDEDATHSHQFGQIEGLVVDENVRMSDLLGTLELFVKKMFGEKRKIRMRPSYFPFTEPSVEVDISCFECGGKGCSLCKHSGWIEILGAGMVHPNVLKMCGFDTKKYQGFAFGVGIERVAMLRYGIDDIRRFYTNDMRFNKQFHRE